MCEEKQFMHNIPSYLVAQGDPSSHPSLKNPEEANTHCPCTLTIHCALIIEQFRRKYFYYAMLQWMIKALTGGPFSPSWPTAPGSPLRPFEKNTHFQPYHSPTAKWYIPATLEDLEAPEAPWNPLVPIVGINAMDTIYLDGIGFVYSLQFLLFFLHGQLVQVDPKARKKRRKRRNIAFHLYSLLKEPQYSGHVYSSHTFQYLSASCPWRAGDSNLPLNTLQSFWEQSMMI